MFVSISISVQSPGQIKITDFGLAKLLDYNEDEYVAGGGKVGTTCKQREVTSSAWVKSSKI